MELPILKFEEEIVETVRKNSVVVLIGETGSGKSTQLSQILHRHGYTKSGAIGITQPRRVAAVSVSRRVAAELGVTLGEEVGYAIRFEDRTSQKTCIKYLTDGVLLRESLSDPELNHYSVIILDEAHERSLNTDILLGLMKHLIKVRPSNLKVLITSATLDGAKVSKFFSGCPVLTIPGKLFPVEILYSKETPTSYLEASIQRALDIHVRESPGDILLFMTGQDDIDKAVKKLEERVTTMEEGSCMDAIILPLHGSLPPEMQVRVFLPAPRNCRRIIVATNIAETSLTVDGVVYVIDAGYVKQRQYNPSTGMYSLDVVKISRVQADQRSGRAGRTRPGKCYRLYPSSVYHDELLEATIPEIQRSSLAGTVLYLKSLGLADIDVLRFDFLDQPSYDSLEDALKQLYLIDAIDGRGSVTDIGRMMAELPLEPSLSRTLIAANELGCLSQALTVAAMLSSENIWAQTSRFHRHQTNLQEGEEKEVPRTVTCQHRKNNDKKRKPIQNLPDGSGWGDHIQLLQIYECWSQSDYDPKWCIDHNLQVRGMMFAKEVRKQLSQIMQKIARGPVDVQSNYRRQSSSEDYAKLRWALCKGFGNQLAQRMIHHNGYRTLSHRSQLVQVHPSSVLQPDEYGSLPDYVVYNELITTSRPFMRYVCAVKLPWIMPISEKLEKMDINLLSGGQSAKVFGSPKATLASCNLDSAQHDVTKTSDEQEKKIQAARERFLARKLKK